MQQQAGFSLIELVIFIVIAAFSTMLLLPIFTALRHAGTLPNQTKAQQIGQARMELMLEQRAIAGFSSFTDPCAGVSPPAICTPPTGFSVAATIANNWNADTNYKVITVDVTGSAEAHFISLAANYE